MHTCPHAPQTKLSRADFFSFITCIQDQTAEIASYNQKKNKNTGLMYIMHSLDHCQVKMHHNIPTSPKNMTKIIFHFAGQRHGCAIDQ